MYKTTEKMHAILAAQGLVSATRRKSLRHQPSRSRACGKIQIIFTSRGCFSKPARVCTSNRQDLWLRELVCRGGSQVNSKSHEFNLGVFIKAGTPMTLYRRELIAVHLEDIRYLDLPDVFKFDDRNAHSTA